MQKKSTPHYEEVANTKKSTLMVNSFIGGLAWAVGATIGFSLLIALLTVVGNKIDVVPVVGKFISDVIDFILQYNTHI